MEAAETAVCLVMKAMLLSGRWAGRSRRLGLEQAAKAAGEGAEVQADNVMLRDTIEFLGERLACAERRLQAAHIRTPYSLAERLHICGGSSTPASRGGRFRSASGWRGPRSEVPG